MTRFRRVITATASGFLVEADYLNPLGHWRNTSRGWSAEFPWHQVADLRSDVQILVRVAKV